MINGDSKRLFEFGPFRVDRRERMLTRDGVPVPLTPKVFEILLALVENRGHTLGKDELIDRVWPDAYVEAGNLNRNISTLRSVLGEDGHNPRFIKTLPKQGYRFDADVREILVDEEELVVERQTDYRITFRETTTKNTQPLSALLRKPAVMAAAAAIVFVMLALAYTSRSGNQKTVVSDETVRAGGTENVEMLELYHKGRILWQDRSGESLHKATMLLEQAVEKDPNFALAHSALADAYAFDIQHRVKAEASARRAIEINPELGEPHATLGFLKMFWEQNYDEAELHFKQAITLSPNYATGHQWYAINLMAGSQGNEALAEMRTALDLEPDSLPINADMCQILYFTQRFDEAETQCKKTLELNPRFLNANLYLCDIYSAKGMHDAAVAQFFRIEELAPNYSAFPRDVAELKDAYKTGGIRAFWQKRIVMLKKLPAADYSIARYYARLGETNNTFESLKNAHEQQDLNLLYFLAEPLFLNCCYSDPRYDELQSMLIGRKGRGY